MQGRTSSPTLIPLFRPQRSSYPLMSEQSSVTRAPLLTPEYNSPLPLGNHNARKKWKGYCPIPPRGAQCQRGVPWPTWAWEWSRDRLSKGESLKKLGWREDPPAQISRKTATLSSLFKKTKSRPANNSVNQPATQKGLADGQLGRKDPQTPAGQVGIRHHQGPARKWPSPFPRP